MYAIYNTKHYKNIGGYNATRMAISSLWVESQRQTDADSMPKS